MANQIKIKRSQGVSNAAAVAGELQWLDHDAAGGGGDEGILYIGDAKTGGSTIRSIGGPGWLPPLAAPLASPALTGNPTAPTQGLADNSTKLATTAYVDGTASAQMQSMSTITDTVISAPAAGHVLVYDGTNSWDNKAISGGHITMDATGAMTIIGVGANTVDLGTDTVGNYVAGITGTANEVEVSANASEGSTPQIGLPSDVTIGNDLTITRDLGVGRNLDVTGNLTVSGTTTTVDSTTVSVADPIFIVGQNASDDNKDRGMSFKYNDGSAKLGFFGYDDSAGKFTVLTGATNTAEVMSGTAADAVFGAVDGTTATFTNVAGTLTTAAQPNITTVGTITTGTWAGTTIGNTKGGTGQDSSSWTGIASVSGGTWSVQAEVPVTQGGTGRNTLTSNGVIYGNATGDVGMTAAGTSGQFLSNNAGTPVWSDSIDGGTF
jgi:hypothetical protein